MAFSGRAGLKIAEAVRNQIAIELLSLDELLPPDHRARDVWAYVSGLDLATFYATIKVATGRRGHAAIDPAILVALWLYATLESIGSARALERLCESDLACRWLRGGVGVNYHTLADFRTDAGAFLDELLTSSMTALVKAGALDLSCLAVDGVKVRASAGSHSFRRDVTLARLEDAARRKVAALRQELASDPAASATRAAQRNLVVSAQRLARIAKAREVAAAIAARHLASAASARRKAPAQTRPPRASTTDPDARVMHMADGGWRPAYNVQVKTDPLRGLVVGVEVSQGGADRNQLLPAVADIERRYGKPPGRILADGGYEAKEAIEALHEREIVVYCPPRASKVADAHSAATANPAVAAQAAGPVAAAQPAAVPEAGTGQQPAAGAPQTPEAAQKRKKQAADKARARNAEGPGVRAWRERMQSEAGKAMYAQRFACERPHADMRNRGLQQFAVRGLNKVKASVLWFVHACNFRTIMRINKQLAA